MPLDSTMMNAVTSALVKLCPKTWRDKLVTAARLRRDKSIADKAARELDARWKAAQSEVFAAIGSAPGAVCGDLVVTVKTTAASPATVTLADGQVIKWSAVTSLLIGNVTVPASQVAKMFGGRDNPPTIEIAGA